MLLGVGPRNVWISANELVSEGTYEWGFNTGDTVEFFEWGGGQPSNNVCPDGGDYECINDQEKYFPTTQNILVFLTQEETISL